MRVQDYSLPKEVPTETKEFLDNIRVILNNGGYVPQTIGAVPGWAGEEGESVNVVSGAEQRMYYFNNLTGLWNYGIPVTSKYGWTYLTVSASEAAHVGNLSFGFTFQLPPTVICSFIGYQASGTPTGPADFDTGLTRIAVATYGVTTSSVDFAVYTGDGTNFPGAYNMGISWLAIG